MTLPVSSAVVPCCPLHGKAASSERTATTLFNGSPFETGALQKSGESRIGAKGIKHRFGVQADRVRAIAQSLLQQRKYLFLLTQSEVDDGEQEWWCASVLLQLLQNLIRLGFSAAFSERVTEECLRSRAR